MVQSVQVHHSDAALYLHGNQRPPLPCSNERDTLQIAIKWLNGRVIARLLDVEGVRHLHIPVDAPLLVHVVQPLQHFFEDCGNYWLLQPLHGKD